MYRCKKVTGTLLIIVLDEKGWLERQTVNAKVATVLGSIPASSDTVESEG